MQAHINCTTTSKDINPRPEVIPSIQEWYGAAGSVAIDSSTRIIVNDHKEAGLIMIAHNMKTDIKLISGLELRIDTDAESAGDNDIYIETSSEAEVLSLGAEGYQIDIDYGIHIIASTYTGCLYGTITIEQILWQDEEHTAVPKGVIRDYPAYRLRGLMLDIARTPYRYELLKDYARIMLWYKLNELHLHINDNDNANIQGANNLTHSGFHRIESKEFPSLLSETKHAGIPQDLVNSDYYNYNEDYKGNPQYSYEQYRELQRLCKDKGIHVLTELDMPGHALLYNKYAYNNPDNIDWLEGGCNYTGSEKGAIELLDLIGPNKERALRLATTLWDEYTRGEKPVIDADIVHIGADEYWIHNDETNAAFAVFADTVRKTVQNNLGSNTKIRMWGATSSSFSKAAEVLGKSPKELAKDYQLDIWHMDYDDPIARIRDGFQIVNCRDCFLYSNPGRTGRDVPNAEYLFNSWNPTMFGEVSVPKGEPNLLGAKAAIWGDQSQEGMTEKDIHQRVLRTMAIISEKTWEGTAPEDTFDRWELRSAILAEGPGTNIAMAVESASSLVLNYDFANVSKDGRTVFDISGNGYNGELSGGHIEDRWLKLDGNTLIKTPLRTLSYPYTISFDIKLSKADKDNNTGESSLLSGYDGRIQIAGDKGKLSADVNYFTRKLNYDIPGDDKARNITIVGTFQAIRLYVDGKLISFLSQKIDEDGVYENAVSTLYSSVLLPLEKIGQGLYGSLANIRVYNKALYIHAINGSQESDICLVDVAQNAYAGGSSYREEDAANQDSAIPRTRIAMKAINGETFTDATDDSSEIYSYWQGEHEDSFLTVDLGKMHAISQVELHWQSSGIGKNLTIQVSEDGLEWQDVKRVVGNTEARLSIALDEPLEARFVRMQGNAGSGVYKLQEILVLEKVDKARLKVMLTETEALMEEKGIGFETLHSQEERELLNAFILGKALLNSPIAANHEVKAAMKRLSTAISKIN